MYKMTLPILLGVTLCAQSVCAPAVEPPAPSWPTLDADGTVHIPAFAMPLSSYMSEEAKKAFIKRLEEQRKNSQAPGPSGADSLHSDCPERELHRRAAQELVTHAREIYPVDIQEQRIAGVRTDVVMPKGGVSARNRNRVLISLHGGSYSCASAGGLSGQIQAIPIAGVGKFKVIAIDYRTSPGYKFPAANEDVAAVYKDLLKTYKARNIGLYGCSTGATLVAGSMVWFQREHLPRPGAVGLFGEGASKDDHVDGDSWYLSAALGGITPPTPGQTSEALFNERYMTGTDPKDPLVAPVTSPEVLSKFPPTLLISSTRDIGLSEALHTHARLVKAGVQADLHVWEGLWHCFFLQDVDMPESKEVFDVTAKFFDRNLGL